VSIIYHDGGTPFIPKHIGRIIHTLDQRELQLYESAIEKVLSGPTWKADEFYCDEFINDIRKEIYGVIKITPTDSSPVVYPTNLAMSISDKLYLKSKSVVTIEVKAEDIEEPIDWNRAKDPMSSSWPTKGI
jgi:hypothetical protein